MKILLLPLAVACLTLAACASQTPTKPSDTGSAGQGLGGQTVGTSFSGSVGAGDSVTRGKSVGASNGGVR